METKILIILSSSRKASNTKLLTQKLFASIDSETIDLLDFKISQYDYQGHYSETDQFLEVIEKVLLYETIVFATPVYWYSMSGLLKVFFDRLTDIVTIEKHIGRKLKGKNIFLVSIGTDLKLPEGFEIPFQLTSGYLEMNFIETYYCSTKNLPDNLANQNNFLKIIKSTIR
ncbi:MAG: NAD(P)H-dependent oxidoreductase [Bacteroidota bacterium]|nr:NAD(P)H-dependent oxidoreductase [Bacteroidota bacterium]